MFLRIGPGGPAGPAASATDPGTSFPAMGTQLPRDGRAMADRPFGGRAMPGSMNTAGIRLDRMLGGPPVAMGPVRPSNPPDRGVIAFPETSAAAGLPRRMAERGHADQPHDKWDGSL